MKQVENQLKLLHKIYNHPGLLNVGPAWCVLLAVIFSARTKDEQVLKLLPGFFERFPSLTTLSKASLLEINDTLSFMGMYRQKAKHAKGVASMLLERYNGQVPQDIESLTSLPGVGRKTASVVLSACFNVPSIAVDVHVFRVVHRLGWINESTPNAVEKALKKILPIEYWQLVNQVFVPFGRTICTARKPSCWRCPLRDSCLYQKKNSNLLKMIWIWLNRLT